VAIELTRARLKSMIGTDGRPIPLPNRVLAGLVAAVLAIALTSVFVAQHNAERDESAALRRLADVQTLLASPPVDTAALKQQLDAAKADAETLQSASLAPSVDPGSDAAASLLVVHAQSAGLAVKGITRPNPSTAKFDSGSYEVRGLRITVEGTTSQVLWFLADMHKVEPALVAALGEMAVAQNGVARADIAFNAYTKVVSPTPVPRAISTPAVGR
jgi:hypothetical protein